MSLKAKIEAVIYAAEEPVTLAQLAAIFAAEMPSPVADLPEQLEAPFPDSPEADAPATDAQPAGAAAEIEASAEITVINEAGTMSDFFSETAPGLHDNHRAAHQATLETAPLLAEDAGTVDTDPAAFDAPGAGRLTLVDNDSEVKRLARQRDRGIRDHIRVVVDELIGDYVVSDRGIEIREIAGGFRMATKPEYHDGVRAFVKSLKPVMKLSMQALETLAVIAYKQPVTAPEVAEIRGVDAGGVLASLISRKLVTTAGRKQVIGRPILYKTTKEFLLRFGLKDIAELPSMEEFEKMAGELAESDAIEADAMHEKAGIALVPDREGSEPLPFESDTPEEQDQDSEADGEQELPGNAEGNPSSTQSGAVGHAQSPSAPAEPSTANDTASATDQAASHQATEENIPQEQES